MKKISLFAGLVAMTLMLMGSMAQAGTLVMSASGTIGGVELDNVGVNGNTATIVINRTPNLNSFVDTVNVSSIVPDPVTVQGPVTLLVTQNGTEHYSLALAPPTYTESVGPVGNQSIMAFDMESGVAPSTLPNFFNMSGKIVSLIANNNLNFDYSEFKNGGNMNMTFTGTQFSGGVNSFAQLFATPGSSVVVNGSFSQIATVVAEPTSIVMGMMGLPIALLLAHKVRKRAVTKS